VHRSLLLGLPADVSRRTVFRQPEASSFQLPKVSAIPLITHDSSLITSYRDSHAVHAGVPFPASVSHSDSKTGASWIPGGSPVQFMSTV
jgi:hypothetical protein